MAEQPSKYDMAHQSLQQPEQKGVQPHSTAEQQMQVKCWACGVLVHIPLVSGAPSPIFKCGWCGAISEALHPRALDAHGKQTRPQHKPHSTSSRCGAVSRTLLRGIASLKAVVVVLVLLLIGSLIVLGVAFVLTRNCTTQVSWSIHTFITWLISFGTLFNYFAAVFLSPGSVKECIELPTSDTQDGLVPRGSYEGYKYCWVCRAPKPPGTHHCRACRTCIVDMDHHCPFINSCVGRANLRNFVLFLMWAVAAGVYGFIMAGYLLWNERVPLLFAMADAWDDTRKQGSYWAFPAYVILGVPLYVTASMYVAGAAAAVAISVGVLLWSQLSHIMRGTSYIDALQHPQQFTNHNKQCKAQVSEPPQQTAAQPNRDAHAAVDADVQSSLAAEHATRRVLERIEDAASGGHACDPSCSTCSTGQLPEHADMSGASCAASQVQGGTGESAPSRNGPTMEAASAASVVGAGIPSNGSGSVAGTRGPVTMALSSSTGTKQPAAAAPVPCASHAGMTRGSGWRKLVKVMGDPRPLTWLLPVWGPPEGVLLPGARGATATASNSMQGHGRRLRTYAEAKAAKEAREAAAAYVASAAGKVKAQ